MPQLTTVLEIPVSKESVYQYFLKRYEGKIYQSACAKAVGYSPPIKCIEEVPNEKIAFWAPSRLRLAAWKWGYDFESVGSDKTKITIWYEWGLFSNLATVGTSRKQAANETAQTALALEALIWKSS